MKTWCWSHAAGSVSIEALHIKQCFGSVLGIVSSGCICEGDEEFSIVDCVGNHCNVICFSALVKLLVSTHIGQEELHNISPYILMTYSGTDIPPGLLVTCSNSILISFTSGPTFSNNHFRFNYWSTPSNGSRCYYGKHSADRCMFSSPIVRKCTAQ